MNRKKRKLLAVMDITLVILIIIFLNDRVKEATSEYIAQFLVSLLFIISVIALIKNHQKHN